MAALPAATEGRRDGPAAQRLPTLTEVVEIGQPATAEPGMAGSAAASGAAAPAPVQRPPAPLPDMLELGLSVLAELQPRIEMLLETRLREALAPALARAADGLIRDTREQLSETLQALVQEAVAKVLEQRPAG